MPPKAHGDDCFRGILRIGEYFTRDLQDRRTQPLLEHAPTTTYNISASDTAGWVVEKEEGKPHGGNMTDWDVFVVTTDGRPRTVTGDAASRVTAVGRLKTREWKTWHQNAGVKTGQRRPLL